MYNFLLINGHEYARVLETLLPNEFVCSQIHKIRLDAFRDTAALIDGYSGVFIVDNHQFQNDYKTLRLFFKDNLPNSVPLYILTRGTGTKTRRIIPQLKENSCTYVQEDGTKVYWVVTRFVGWHNCLLQLTQSEVWGKEIENQLDELINDLELTDFAHARIVWQACCSALSPYVIKNWDVLKPQLKNRLQEVFFNMQFDQNTGKLRALIG